MENFSGIKELYDVSLRLNNPITIGEKNYDINESILTFKTAEMAEVSEVKEFKEARGGQLNTLLVSWETDTQVDFAIKNGVLSPTSWSILSNSKQDVPNIKSVQFYEELTCNENEQYCYTDLKYIPNHVERLGAQPNPDLEPMPMGRRPELMLKPLPPSKTKWIFCYDTETGKRIMDFEVFKNRVFFKESYRKVMVDYTFSYEDNVKVIEVGNRLINGFLRLTGKMSVKDQITGRVTTAILEMPKIKLSSGLSMKLGKSCQNSVVSDFFFTSYPDDSKGRRHSSVANITFLDKELTEDYL